MLNFGASKPRVRGGPAPGAPPGSAPAKRDNKLSVKRTCKTPHPVCFFLISEKRTEVTMLRQLDLAFSVTDHRMLFKFMTTLT